MSSKIKYNVEGVQHRKLSDSIGEAIGTVLHYRKVSVSSYPELYKMISSEMCCKL